MSFISVVFTCKRRLPLAQLVLHRFVELMDLPYEIVLAYNNDDKDYITTLQKICNFDHILSSRKFRFDLMQDAYELCSGDYFMHLEDDFYWDNPNAVKNAIWVLENNPDISFVRMSFLPFHEKDFTRIIDVKDDKFGIFLPRKNGGVAYQFCLNPHIRKDKIPIPSGFIDAKTYLKLSKTNPIQPERWMSDRWDELNKLSGCLMGKNFRHLGLYDTGGHKKFWYADRFFLERNSPREFDPVEEFNNICQKELYRKLFAEYIKENENVS